MSKKPLRERLAGMMPAELLLPISFDHQQLLKRMSIIDRTIDFLGVHRGQKIIFFEALRKNISESAATSIEIKTILQLMYLDENSYHLEWKMNEKIKRFDLKITLPEIESMDLRKADMRKKIVKFLLIQEAELLT